MTGLAPVQPSPVIAAGEALADALRTIPELRVDVGHGRPVVPPAAVVSPPTLTWEGYCRDGQPHSATWQVSLVAVHSEYATNQLLEWVPAVATAIEEHTGAVVTTAVPGVHTGAAGADLPAYQLTVEMEL